MNGRPQFPIIALIAAVVVIYPVMTYNSLVRQDQKVEQQWAQVETQYQRRVDLIPNLVKASKAMFKQEQTVFTKIAEARQAYAGARDMNERLEAMGALDATVGRLLAIVEAYPDLKSHQTLMATMDEMAGTENRVSVERRRFNQAVQGYNTKVKQFPARVIASWFGFEPKNYFNVGPQAHEMPTVEFD